MMVKLPQPPKMGQLSNDGTVYFLLVSSSSMDQRSSCLIEVIQNVRKDDEGREHGNQQG